LENRIIALARWRLNLSHWADILLEPLLIAMILVIPFEKHTAQILNTAIFGALGVVVVILFAKGRTGKIATALDLPILVFVLIAILSTIFSVDALISLKSIRRTLIKFLFVYYLTIYGASNVQRVKRLVFAFLIGSVALSSYGLHSFFSGYGMLDGRIHSTFYHPTRFANYLVFVAAISFSLAAHYRSSRGIQAFLYAIFGLGASCLVLTASRGANLGLLLGFVIVFGLRDKRVWTMLAVIVLISVAIIPFQSNHLHFMKATEFLSGKLGIDTVLGERQFLWRSGLSMAKDNPVLGIGYGKTYNLVYESTYALAGATQDHSSAHNVLIEIALEMGPLGLAVFLWLHILIFKEALCLVRDKKTRNTFAHALSAGILIALIGVTCNGMANHFYRDRPILVYWLFVGLVFCLRRLTTRRPHQRRTL